MKTAISIPDSIFKAAEKAAERLSMSRSQLYTKAIKEFVDVRAPANVTEKLDKVYAETPSTLDPGLTKLQSLSLGDGSW